jgi:hypothetical protein
MPVHLVPLPQLIDHKITIPHRYKPFLGAKKKKNVHCTHRFVQLLRHVCVLAAPLDGLPHNVCARWHRLALGRRHHALAQGQQQRSQQEKTPLLLINLVGWMIQSDE